MSIYVAVRESHQLLHLLGGKKTHFTPPLSEKPMVGADRGVHPDLESRFAVLANQAFHHPEVGELAVLVLWEGQNH